ncbi:YitT family protein ['Elaeagnus angustifolia' witches'-broom phytoplasma]|uniref:YitT family protein n=1 Tax='Elaeagnus angustifolia' witches'-broom phytoplasma TaxID=1538355 RepID=A0ABS5VCU5_9MOLU|nr:YitT family protein ['Elaeagnus angustifolia' witches'-broom phytoplasma]MCX2955600.1 YitT family protein [Candidatus Phytoplasma australiense]
MKNSMENIEKFPPIKKKIQYVQEFKKILILSLSLIVYVLVSVWAFDCTRDGGYKTDLFPTGVIGLGNVIGKLLHKAGKIETNNIIVIAGTFYFVVNVFLLFFISRRYLGKYFTITTAFATVLLFVSVFFIENQVKQGFLYHTERFFGIFKTESDFLSDLTRVFFAGILIGIFNGIPVRIGASTGGLDIVAKYLSVYKKKDISFVVEMFGYTLMIFGAVGVFIIEYFYKETGLKELTTQISLSLFYTVLRIKLSALFMGLITSVPQKETKLNC